MRFFCVLAVVLLAACPLLADEQPQDANTLTKQLQGRWEIVGGVNQGRELAVAAVRGTYVTVELNTITTYDASEQQRFQAVFQIDESKKPVQITMTDVPSNAATKPKETDKRQDTSSSMAAGILKFDGKNQWVLCYGLPGADRPQKFASPAGSKVMLFKMERKKPNAGLLDASQPLNKE